MDRELKRQILHVALGLLALGVLLLLGRGTLIALLFFTILAGTVIINLRLRGKKVWMVEWFEEHFERKNILLPGWGSACYAIGMLIVVTALNNINEMAAVMVILGLGDAASTLAGKDGEHSLPYNKNKTIEGTIAFFIASLPAYYFIGPLAIPLALVATLAETIPSVEDNITVPIACCLFLLVI